MFEALIVGFHLGSIHLPAKDFNNINPGVYIRTPGDEYYIAGTYYNSQRRMAAYVAKGWESEKFGVAVGGVIGYRAGPLPVVFPYYKFDNGLRLSILPRVTSDGSTVVHFMYEYK